MEGNSMKEDNLALSDEQVRTLWLVPRKIQKRRAHFIRFPFTWLERLEGAHGQTYRLALLLLYRHWKGGGEPILLANGMLAIDGVPPTTKLRALRDLERRGLVAVDWRLRKSPVVRLTTSP
jgi:hypothetical protein